MFKETRKGRFAFWSACFSTALVGLTVGAPGPSPLAPSESLVPPELILQHENFILDLHNGFAARGITGFTRQESIHRIWGSTNLKLFAETVQGFFASGGAVVSSQGISTPTTLVRVEPGANRTLELRTEDLPMALPFAKQSHFEECSPIQLDLRSSEIGEKIASNLFCIYHQTLRTKYLWLLDQTATAASASEIGQTVPPPFDREFITQSGVREVLSNYLNQLVGQQMVRQFTISAAVDHVGLELTTGVSGPKKWKIGLRRQLVNIYRNEEEEARRVTEVVRYTLETRLLSPQPDLKLLSVRIERLARALSAAAKRPSPSERRKEFFNELGYGYLLEPAGGLLASSDSDNPCGPVGPYSYGSSEPVVTPKNNLVVNLFGWNMPFFRDSHTKLEDGLSKLGYKTLEINGDQIFRPGHSVAELCPLQHAHTLLLDGHGAGGLEGAFVLATDPNVKFRSKAQCEQLKAITRSLGDPRAALIDCLAPDWDGLTDPWVDFSAIASFGGLSVEYTLYMRGLSGGGEKAFLSTLQCFGGVMQADFVVDGMTGSTHENMEPDWKRDVEIFSDDVLGTRQYCRSPESKERREPFDRHVCEDDDSALAFSAGGLRTAQRSVAERLSKYPDGTPWVNDRDVLGYFGSLRKYFNDRGVQSYLTANLKGKTNQELEFAPMVKEVEWNPSRRELSGQFSSPVVEESVNFSVLPHECRPKRATDAAFDSPMWFNDRQFGFKLGNTFSMMSEQEWNMSEEAFQARYGVSKASWPYYVEIKLSGRAPNGIGLVGNNSFEGKPWIWANGFQTKNTPAYQAFNGVAGQKQFRLRLPCKPPTVCCLPNVEWDASSGVPQARVNGEICIPDMDKALCSVGTCLQGDATIGYTTTAGTGMTEEQCEGGSYQSFAGSFHLWHEPCSAEKGCERTIEETHDRPQQCSGKYLELELTGQHIERPWDRHEPQQCQTQRFYAECERACGTSADCSAGEICGASGYCQSGCIDSSDCGSGEFCSAGGECTSGSSPGGLFDESGDGGCDDDSAEMSCRR